MSTEKIELLINSLPHRDIAISNKFLKNRDFHSLKEIVDSALYKIKKSLKSENPKEEYLNINLDDLNSLKAEVDIYIARTSLPEEDDYNIYNNYDMGEFY